MTWGQNFYTRCAKDEWTGMPTLAALRAAIFLLSAKNRWRGHICAPPAMRGIAHPKHYHAALLWNTTLRLSPAPIKAVCVIAPEAIRRDGFVSCMIGRLFWPRQRPKAGAVQQPPSVPETSEIVLGGCRHVAESVSCRLTVMSQPLQ